MRYPDCQREDGDCSACALSSYGRDCRGNPANLLAHLRGNAGMTQQQLADAAGINLRMVQYIECGQRKLGNTTLSTAAALARALGVRIEDLAAPMERQK